MFGLSPVWIWALIGIALVILEAATVTFFFVFLGAGALITALAAALGVQGLASQILIFAASSVLLILVLRRSARNLFAGHRDMLPDFVGEKVDVIEDIPAGREGCVLYRGSRWIAYSDDAGTIPKGSVVKVVTNDGIKLKVKRM